VVENLARQIWRPVPSQLTSGPTGGVPAAIYFRRSILLANLTDVWFEFSGAIILRHFAGARLRYSTKAPALISRAGFILISTYRLLQMKSI